MKPPLPTPEEILKAKEFIKKIDSERTSSWSNDLTETAIVLIEYKDLCLKEAIEILKGKADSIKDSLREDRARKGVYIDCIMILKERIK